ALPIYRSRVLVAIQHARPRRAAVGAAIDAALLVRRAVLAERAGENDVAVRRMHTHAREVARLAQSDVRQCLAAVRRAIEAVARLDVAAQLRLARADVDDVRIRRAHCDRADRCRIDLVVGDGLPGRAAVHRLPEAAAGGAEVVL